MFLLLLYYDYHTILIKFPFHRSITIYCKKLYLIIHIKLIFLTFFYEKCKMVKLVEQSCLIDYSNTLKTVFLNLQR